MFRSGRTIGLFLSGLACCFLGEIAANAMVVPADPAYTISLNGKWRFKLEQSKGPTTAPANWGQMYPIDTPATFEPFHALDYREDNRWSDLDVPGNWEIAGFSPAKYNQADNASGFYRLWFDVPQAWEGRIVRINFDGVQNAAEVWLNGRPVEVDESSWQRENYHESGWTAWQADLTPAVKFGQKNLLALRVTKNTQSSDLDSGDYFFLGGVYRPVTLFAVPKTHIDDVTIRTNVLPGGKGRVQAMVKLVGDDASGVKVAVAVEGSPAIETTADAQGRADLALTVDNPRLWSAEHPDLYPLTIELKDKDGKPLERLTRKVGIREISIKDGVLLVNGVPVKLTGICRHDLYPSQGTAVGEELWRKELTLAKAANVNAIRTSHYPYGAGFYDLCDEMGFYVLDEVPYCWCPTDREPMRPAFEQRARETIRRDKNHACVIIWGIGNENKAGPNLQVAADIVKAMDPTRPRIVSQLQAHLFSVEMDDAHYPTLERMRAAAQDNARRPTWPMLYSEHPNTWDVRLGADPGCWDLWAPVLQRTWDIIWKTDGMPGAFLWEWQDRAVADKCPDKLYEFDPATGMQYLKIKGIVDGWRNPRPWYYHLKMVYAPIVVGRDINVEAQKATFEVENRYSFTDLSELRVRWVLLKDGMTIRTGNAQPKLAPRSKGRVELAVGVLPSNADTLRVDFDDPARMERGYAQFPIGQAPTPPSDMARLPAGLHFPQLNLVINITASSPAKWMQITRQHGRLVNIKTDPANAGGSLGDFRSMEADVVLENDPAIVAHVRSSFTGGRFSYQLEWSGKEMDIQELGWIFQMPHEFDRFSWKREAMWSFYPETHIGRPTGTARPDSSQVPVMNMNRPDAYDFNSTKYQADWATLTDAQGHGLRIEFDAQERHQVRGGFGPGGAYQLIVNKQCSPPRDIRSPIVPDLYLKLSAGQKIASSFRIGSALRGEQ